MKLEDVPIAQHPLPEPIAITPESLGMGPEQIALALDVMEQDNVHSKSPELIAVQRTTLFAFGDPGRVGYVRDDR